MEETAKPDLSESLGRRVLHGWGRKAIVGIVMSIVLGALSLGYLLVAEGADVARDEIPFVKAAIFAAAVGPLLTLAFVWAEACLQQRNEARAAVRGALERELEAVELSKRRGRLLIEARRELRMKREDEHFREIERSMSAIRVEAVGVVSPVDLLSLSRSLGILLCGSGATSEDLRMKVPAYVTNGNLGAAINVADRFVKALDELGLIEKSFAARSGISVNGYPVPDVVYKWSGSGLAVFGRISQPAARQS